MRTAFIKLVLVFFFTELVSFASFAQNKISCIPPTINASSDATICNGQSASISVTHSSTSAPYTYQWTPTTGVVCPTCSNTTTSPTTTTTYTIVVTDGVDCTSLPDFVTITVNPTPTISVSGDNTICQGESTTLTASGNSSSYTWNPGALPGASITVSPTTGTNYTVTGTHANGCTANATYSVTVNTTPTISISGDNVICQGESTTLTASGNSASYVWNPGGLPGASITVSPTTGTNYTVTGTHASGCTATATYSVTVNTTPTISISGDNVICQGESTTLTASGNSSSYTWNPGALPGASITVSPTTGTNYTVTGTHASGCTATATYSVTVNTTPTISISGDNVICKGENTTLTASGNSSSYTWNPGAVAGASITVSPTTGTNYTVTGTHASGCTATATYSVTVNPTPTITISSTSVSCNGGNDGTATVTAGSGTPAYTYLWNPSSQNSSAATGLSATNYTVTVTDANGCTVKGTVTIDEPTAISTTVTSNDASCGNSNGDATVSASGGVSGFSYLWNTTPVQTTATATGLSAGSYTVTVTDANNCTRTDVANISNPTGPVLATSTSSVSCNGGNDGTASVTVTSGIGPPYTYMWSDGQTTTTATGLQAGPYTITVIDATPCTTIAAVNITEPLPLSIPITSTSVTCNGYANGSATVTPTGGTGSYTYSWATTSPTQTTATATGLTAGDYILTVTDGNGCTATNTVTIAEPSALMVPVSSTSVNCNGDSTGTATVTPSGGTLNYSYSWSTTPTQTTDIATGLPIGDYTVTVTDGNGCTATNTVTIAEPSALMVPVSSTSVNCNGDSTGTATVTPSGGTLNYSYSWSTTPTQTTDIAIGLPVGNYTVTVTDGNGCTAANTVTIAEPSALMVPVSSTSVNCNGDSTGTATVTPSGGTLNYSYSWSTTPAQTTDVATGLPVGNYTVTVTDGNGCTATSTVTIVEPAALAISVISNSPSCNGDSSGSITINTSGGTPGYTYSWNPTTPVQTTPSAIGLVPGDYTVTITDANGCITDSVITVNNVVVTASVTATDSTICSGQTTTLTASGGTNYSWSPQGGLSNPNISNPVATVGAIYTVTVSIGACSDTASITIVVNPLPTPSISATSATTICVGDCVSLIASGGSTYTWTPTGQTTPGINVCPTTASAYGYTVTVTDGNNCTANASTVINALPSVTVTVSGDTVICEGEFTTLVAQGGGTYLWNTGDITSSITVNPAAYTGYTVTASNGACSDTDSVHVTVLPVPTANASASLYTINIGNSTTLTGTTSTGTYNWSPATGLSCVTCANPIASPTATTIYTLITVDANSCTAIDTVIVNVNLECSEIFVPSAFSPNTDGFNDYLYVRNPCIKAMEFVVYNRWGQKVFITTDRTQGWDGTFQGKLLDPAVFFYTLYVQFITNEERNVNGSVTLVR